MKFTRRTAMEVLGAGALTPAAMMPLAAAQVPAAPKESKGTPKIAVGMGDSGVPMGGRGRGQSNAPTDPLAGPKRIKQIGVNQVLSGGGAPPWTEDSLKTLMKPWNDMGITVGNLMINLSPDI